MMTDCIACGGSRIEEFLDLGRTPLANKFLAEDELATEEAWYPLGVARCHNCGHVQLTHRVPPAAMFDDYLYISSLSKTLVDHLHGLAETMVRRCGLGADDLLIDVGCNDGTLLAGAKKLGVRTLGIDPASNLQPLAAKNGVESIVAYFGREVAQSVVEERGQAGAVTATNVFPHIPQFDDFLEGLDIVLRPGGLFAVEAHYLGDLIDHGAFDTVYHEHASYWSLSAARTLFNRFGFDVVDMARLPIHHGQIRLFVQRQGEAQPSPAVTALLREEERIGLASRQNMEAFARHVVGTKADLEGVLRTFMDQGKTVAGYGAPAKGTTLITYLGLGPDTISWIADKSPLKQGRYTPGSHIPVVSPDRILAEQPDYLLLFAWNFVDEIIAEQAEYLRRGGRFILPVPDVKVI